MKYEIEIPDDLSTLEQPARDEKILLFLRDTGKALNEGDVLTVGEYIHLLLMASALFTGFCIKDKKDMRPVKLEVVCPAIMKDMLQTLGENIAEGVKQRQQSRAISLRELPVEGKG